MRLRGWIPGLSLMLLGLVLFDLVASAGIRQYPRRRAIRATTEAELRQEPYRGTTWASELWDETRRYTENWDPYYVYRVGEMRGRHINVVDGVRTTYAAAGAAAAPLVFVFGGPPPGDMAPVTSRPCPTGLRASPNRAARRSACATTPSPAR